MKPLFLFIIFTTSSFWSMAQTGSLTGRIVNQKDGEPLAGATILMNVPDSYRETVGTISDGLGNFKLINLPTGNQTITVSFVGFESSTQNVVIEENKTTQIEIALQPSSLQLKDVTVTATINENKNFNTISAIDLRLRPINTSQDVLRMVPGLFIAQHAGGGKAEQIFLRGFDCDHGTDVNISVDGLPVNMVSHAHGQGYSDLHFLTTELIQSVDFNKGPYYADKGNFTTAGYVAFKTKNVLDRNMIKLEGGQYGTARAVAMINLLNKTKNNFKQSAFVTGEYAYTNGYFVNSQGFGRLNLTGKYTAWWNNRDMITVMGTFFKSQWNASGQIPNRAVAEGITPWFGSIDPTEGGNTQRINASVKQTHTFRNGGVMENQAYFVKYDFNLFSNFTFYLDDPVNGDQINQAENRKVFGYNGSYTQESTLGGKRLVSYFGLNYRQDIADSLRLNHTVKRKYLGHYMLGDLNEINASAFISETLHLSSQLSINAVVRYDDFDFGYKDRLVVNPIYKRVNASVFSPKLNINYNVNEKTSLYFKFGQGFHTNDARVVVAQQGIKTLPKATGFDIGTIWKPMDNLIVNAALWFLDLQQEFVYDGDVGVVEPSGRSRREGIDLSVRYQITNWLYADIDANASKPRSLDSIKGKDYLPLAPTFTSIGGLSFKSKNGLNGSLRYRYMANRPANEDYTLTAKGYFVTDMLINYTQKKYEVGISVENLFNAKWKEAQFETTSRLKNEAAPVTEINFTPGTPFFLKARVSFFF